MNELSTKVVQDKDYESLVKFASKAAIVVAVILVASKIYGWWISNSAAMLASTTDSLLDVFASLTGFMILKYSLAPADEEHKFGHGKAENLAALMQSSFVIGSAILLLIHGVERTINPEIVAHSNIAIAISVLAIVLTLALVFVQKIVIKKTNSIAISADSLHYQSDLLLNVGVIIALLMSQFKWHYADGIFTVLVGSFLLVSAIKIIYNSVQDLMDKELKQDDLDKITAVINKHPQALGFHQLRTRQAGKIKFVQFHLELSDEITLYAAHLIANEIENQLLLSFEHMEVFIHQDPSSVVGHKNI
ncbi:cation diffusion facilitator family transporter [Thalassotalea crassostreae]|uniref:cation diffusion facilitator family transporter n=1 Tax=Thalassotalea crassostreae TaxID=1763536 RepID=UPI0009EF6D36|nr:cation diffusion facilitator family transporter [Thalassotalea crassostreae]